jgi:predicted transcriptional regulator
MVDEDFVYVTNSLNRIDIVYLLDAIDAARNYEVADILCLTPANVLLLADGLNEHGIIDSTKVGKSRIYSLTQKGKQIANKLRDYHGIR